MEMRVYPPRRLAADPRRRLQIRQPRHLHPPRRAEMVQQRPLPRRADSRDLVQLTLADRLGASGAVRGDGEAVRLVAQPLQEV